MKGLQRQGERVSNLLEKRSAALRKLFGEDRFVNELSFVLGVGVVVLVTSVVAAWPSWIGLLATFIELPLLVARYFTYKRNGWHFFMLDFCYFATINLFALIWLGTGPVWVRRELRTPFSCLSLLCAWARLLAALPCGATRWSFTTWTASPRSPSTFSPLWPSSVSASSRALPALLPCRISSRMFGGPFWRICGGKLCTFSRRRCWTENASPKTRS